MAIVLNSWNRILASAPWTARRLHRGVYFNGYMYISGGFNDDLYVKYNDVWRSSNGVTWELVTSNAGWSARSAHGFVVYDNKLWVMGGSGVTGGDFKNDVWYSTNGSTWTQATSGAGWPVRHEFGLTVFDNKMWVIGGFHGGALSDVWYSSNGVTWTLATSNFGMAVREHVVASFLGNLWVFGGDLLSSYSNDIYYSPDGINWTHGGTAAWAQRREHELLNITGEDRLVILGGYNGSDLNDVWESTDGLSWTSVPQNSPFPNRGDFAFTDDTGSAYIIGGYAATGGGTLYNDVWKGGIFATAEFSGIPLTGTPDLSVAFTNLSEGSPESYSWDFGDGGTSTAVNPTHVYSTLGSFTVTLTVLKNGHYSTRVKPAYVVTDITPDFSANVTTGPHNTAVTFTNLTDGDIDSYLWNFGDGGTSTAVNPVHTYLVPGIYTVSLTAYVGLESRIVTKTNYITITITADFVADPLFGSAGTSVIFTDLSDYLPDTWAWDFGDGNTSTEQNPAHVYAYDGVFTVILSVAKNQVTDSETKPNYINVLIRADFVALPRVALINDPIQFMDLSSGSADAWEWDFGDGNTSTEQNPIHIYFTEGLFTVSLKIHKGIYEITEIKENYVEISTGIVGTGFVREQGPSLIFD